MYLSSKCNIFDHYSFLQMSSNWTWTPCLSLYYRTQSSKVSCKT